MNEILPVVRKLCGWGEGRIVGFHFEAGTVPVVTAGLLLLALAAFWGIGRLYRSDASGLRPRRRAGMTAMRVAALLLALLVLVRPTLTTEAPGTGRPRAAILLDTSHSMNIAGERTPGQKRTATTRWDRARPVVEELTERMAGSFEVDCYTFDEAAELACSSSTADQGGGDLAEQARRRFEALQPQGQVTALGDALAEVLQGPSSPSLVILMSDGASNRGRSPLQAAHEAREKGVRLVVAAVGGEGRKDLGIARFDMPDILPKGESANLHVYLQQNGYTDEDVTVVFREEDAELDRKTVRMTRRVVDVPLAFTPKVAGRLEYSVEVLPLEAEISRANNRRIQKATVLDYQARVLLAEHRPRWEWRFALAALIRDKRIGRGGTRAYLADQDPGADRDLFIPSFPQDLEALSGYDVLVLGDLPPSLAPAGRRRPGRGRGRGPWEAVKAFVEKQGGGLILLAGPHHMPHDYWQTPLGQMIPVGRLVQSDPGRPFAILPTPNPLSRTLFRLPSGGGGPEDQPLTARPVLHRCFAGPAHPMAEPLAVHSVLKHQGAPLPVVLLRRYGRGRVLYLGTDDLWRLRGPATHGWHDRFWVQAVLQAGQQKILRGSPHLELRTSRRSYLPAEPIQMQGEALAEDFSPSQAKSIEVTIREATGDQKIVRRGTVAVDQERKGRFAGTLAAPEKEGSYIIEARDPASDRTREVWLHVVAAGPEYEDTRCDRQLLRQLAAAADGEYCELEELINCLEVLQAREEQTTVIRQVPLWDSALVYLLLVAVLTIEWTQRRRANLL